MFTLPIRIYVEDTDFGGVVYHANHLKFMERARTEWLLSLDYSLTEMAEKENSLFVIFKVELKYLRPIHLHNLVEVTVEISKIQNSSITFKQTLRNPLQPEVVYCEGEIMIVCIDKVALRPKSIPTSLREKLV